MFSLARKQQLTEDRECHVHLRVRNRKFYGYRRDHLDPRDDLWTNHHHLMAAKLPTSVDLRANCPPVMDQGEAASCTAHGITGALRYLLIKNHGADFPMARLQLYYDERVIEGNPNEDTGAEIRDGIRCSAKIGVAHESLWSYDLARMFFKPSPEVYTDALKFESLDYARVGVSTYSLKTVLAAGFPVIVGFQVFDSFESDEVDATGIVPMPKPFSEDNLGGHCVLCVGYGQKTGTFTCRNSWGADWGDKGDFYIPEAYLGSSAYGGDYWVIHNATGINPAKLAPVTGTADMRGQ